MTLPAPRLVDVHAHICDPDFDHDRSDVLARAHQAGVAAIVAVGETLADARKNLGLARTHPMLKAAAGLYPTILDAGQADDGDGLAVLRNLEIGLVFQEFELLEYLTVMDNILLPFRINRSLDLTRAANWDEIVALVAQAARNSEPGEWIIGEQTGLVFVLFGESRYWMGAQDTDPDLPNHERESAPDQVPVHGQ